MVAPKARMVATSVRAPGENSVFRQVRSSATRFCPFNIATRSRNAVAKSISPFIERAVISAICCLMPACPAISSSVSEVTMVLSMSATSTALRRPRKRVTSTSMARSPSTIFNCAMSGIFLTMNSQASPAESQFKCWPEQNSLAMPARWSVSGPACREATRMTI